MIDESTFVSVLVVCGRSVVHGKLKCHFLGLGDLSNDNKPVTFGLLE